jgi:serine/threonine protein kinase
MEERPLTPRSDGFGRNKRTQDPLLFKKYFSKYRTIKKIGEGSFGKVYKAEYDGEYYAVKFEDRNKGQNLLEAEATIMTYLKGPNIPAIKSFGYSGEYNVLVMQLLGRSLEELFNKLQKFSVKTSALLIYQMISILQFIHDKHIIHRDIKPDNFVMGLNKKNANLYLLDFGLAKKYRSSRTLVQYPYIKKKKLTGTARYASIHALEEMEQSRRDDMESVGYVIMYFLRGNLPWQGLKIKSKEDKYRKILDKKKETSSKDLCMNFPDEFREYVEYTRNLDYEEEPKYEKYRNKFYNLICKKRGESFDYIYDWTTESDLKKREVPPNEDTEFKATATKDAEIRSKIKEREKIMVAMNNTSNNNNLNPLRVSNNLNNLNQPSIKEEDIMKMEENNIVTDKVDSRCCTIF